MSQLEQYRQSMRDRMSKKESDDEEQEQEESKQEMDEIPLVEQNNKNSIVSSISGVTTVQNYNASVDGQYDQPQPSPLDRLANSYA